MLPVCNCVVLQAVRAVLLSTQGAVITLPYCYCNSEVRRVVTTRWQYTALGPVCLTVCRWARWNMVRTVGSECQQARASVATTNTVYLTQVSTAQLVSSRTV